MAAKSYTALFQEKELQDMATKKLPKTVVFTKEQVRAA